MEEEVICWSLPNSRFTYSITCCEASPQTQQIQTWTSFLLLIHLLCFPSQKTASSFISQASKTEAWECHLSFSRFLHENLSWFQLNWIKVLIWTQDTVLGGCSIAKLLTIALLWVRFCSQCLKDLPGDLSDLLEPEYIPTCPCGNGPTGIFLIHELVVSSCTPLPTSSMSFLGQPLPPVPSTEFGTWEGLSRCLVNRTIAALCGSHSFSAGLHSYQSSYHSVPPSRGHLQRKLHQTIWWWAP